MLCSMFLLPMINLLRGTHTHKFEPSICVFQEEEEVLSNEKVVLQ